MHRHVLRSSLVEDVGQIILLSKTWIIRRAVPALTSSIECMIGWALHVIRIMVFGATSTLSCLPFGNWICLVYIGTLWVFLADIFYGKAGLCGLLVRAVRLIAIDRIGWADFACRVKSYLLRKVLAILYSVFQQIKAPVKTYTVKFVKEVVLENAEDLSAFVSTATGSATLAVVMHSLSSRLAADITPVLFDWIQSADLASGTMNRLLEDVGAIRQSSINTEIRLTEIDKTVTQQFANLHLQLEQIRINQPEKFNEIVMRILPFVSMKDLLSISTTIPVSIIQYLTNKPYTNSLEDGPRF